MSGSVYQRDLEETHEQIVYCRKNVFMIPTGAYGKKFINEITRPFDWCTNDTPLKSITHLRKYMLRQLCICKNQVENQKHEIILLR